MPLKFDQLYRVEYAAYPEANRDFVTGAAALGDNTWVFWTELPTHTDPQQSSTEMKLLNLKEFPEGIVEGTDAPTGTPVRFVPLTQEYVTAHADRYELPPTTVEFIQNKANFFLFFKGSIDDEYLALYDDTAEDADAVEEDLKPHWTL